MNGNVELKCPRCGTVLKPRSIMCIHCGAMLKKDASGKLNVVGQAKNNTKKDVGVDGKVIDENVRVIEADQPRVQHGNDYVKKDVMSTGFLNPVDETSYLSGSSGKKMGILYAKDMKMSNELVDLYIGEHADKLMDLSANWPAFLLGPFWYLYRKQWLPAILYILLYLFSCYAVMTWISAIPILMVTLIFMILNLFFANMIYVGFVKLRLITYQLLHRRMTADRFMNDIEKKGGTNFVLPLIVFFCCLVAGLIYIYFHQDIDVKEFLDLLL